MRTSLLLLSILFSSIVCSQTWTSIGPYGGYFKDFTIHPTNSQIIITGSDDSGGLWKSTDGGQTWNLITGMFPNFTGWKVVFDKLNPNIIYACDLYSRYGLIKSSDGGLTWQIINSGLNTQYDKMVTGLVIANGKHDTLLICTGYEKSGTPPRPGNGVFKSVNGGLTWIASGLQGTTTPCIGSNGNGGAIFVGTRGAGLKITTDLGGTWNNHPQIPLTADITEIETDSNVVMVSAGFSGIYLSTDYGTNFTNIGLTGEFNFDINIFRKTPFVQLFSSTFSGLKKYTSQTGLWTAVSHTELNNHLVMGIASRNNDIYLSNFTNGLILKSTDAGVNWNSVTQSPKATEIGSLYIEKTNPNHIMTSLLGTYNVGGLSGKECISETTDGGVTWLRKGPIGHGGVLTKAPNSLNTFFLGVFGQGLFKTTDGFTTYSNIRTGNKLILDVIVNPSNSLEILISELDLTTNTYAILKSTNGGSSFVNTSSLITTKLEYDASNTSIVYAATFSGLYKSIDGGSTWNIYLFSGLPVSSVRPMTNHIYASLYNGVLFKINGMSSTNITGSWPNNSHITNIIEHNGKLVVGINGAEKDTTLNLIGSTFISADSGTTWANITGNMACTHIYGVHTLQAINNDLYVATYGGGVYKSIGLVLETQEMNFDDENVSVFPNPTQNQLTIEASFDLINAEIKVYNQLGEIEKYISNINSNKMNIETSSLSNGVYFIVLQNEGGQITRKIIINKLQ
ncbi:MAG: T9SS type A sorting domain-containing protein [Bacteroidia bacterium]|nr:T9SS type A sorting domain-containing protein [Bacteroidia bacterium]